MTTLTKQVETSSRRAISSILVGCAMMFVILELGMGGIDRHSNHGACGRAI